MLGLNTCWVGLSYKKNPDVITVEKGEILRCVISLGYGANQGYSHKIKTIENVSKVEGVMPDWFHKGIESALLAPTAINQQKFLFSLKNERQVQAKAGWGFFSKVDLGIVKYHFEVGAGKENFEWI
jgi:nitroreductase